MTASELDAILKTWPKEIQFDLPMLYTRGKGEPFFANNHDTDMVDDAWVDPEEIKQRACYLGLLWLEAFIDVRRGAGYTRIQHPHASGITRVRAYNLNGSLIVEGDGLSYFLAIGAAIANAQSLLGTTVEKDPASP